MILTGTLTNAVAILIGGLIGLFLHSKLPVRYTTIAFQALGLFTIYIGVSMALETREVVLTVIALVAGALIGEAFGWEEGLERLGQRLKKRFGTGNKKFTEGFLVATMLYCVGSMAFLGAVEDGLGQTPTLLYTKSVMDGISSLALAVSFGTGVLFSVVPLLVVQGGITLLAAWLAPYMSEGLIAGISGVGGILLIGLGLNILEITRLRIVNMLPSVILIIILILIFAN